jgi:hypothetical protein
MNQNKCPQCDSSVTVEMDGLWKSYRVCVMNGHVQGGDARSPLAGAMLFPARG